MLDSLTFGALTAELTVKFPDAEAVVAEDGRRRDETPTLIRNLMIGGSRRAIRLATPTDHECALFRPTLRNSAVAGTSRSTAEAPRCNPSAVRSACTSDARSKTRSGIGSHADAVRPRRVSKIAHSFVARRS
jgi:hypothetical protein